jgi:hypothetical protein
MALPIKTFYFRLVYPPGRFPLINLIRIETRRMLFTKVTAALVLSTLSFAYYILSNYTILGSINTAPFSEWSFADYLCRVFPFLLIILLFYETYIFGQKEKSVRTITLTTPISMRDYFAVKTAAIFLAWLPAVVLVIGLGFGFYAFVFQKYEFIYLVVPALLVLLPPAIFIYGLGLAAGSVHNNLLYLISISFFFISVTGFSLLPAGLSLFSSGWIQTYPLSIHASSTGEIPFRLALDYVLSRFIWIFLGAFLAYMVSHKNNKKKGF